MPLSKAEQKVLKQRSYREDLQRMDLTAAINKLLWELYIGFRPVYSMPPHNATTAQVRALPVVEWVPMTRDDVARYSLLLKSNMQLLAKVLPDLKSVELVDDTSNAKQLSDLELAQRLAGLMSHPQLQPGGLGKLN